MKNSGMCLAAGSMAALLGLALPPVMDGYWSSARSASFEARWAIPASTVKQDRLAPPRRKQDIQLVWSVDQQRGVTTLEKVSSRDRSAPGRDRPDDFARKERLPVGCDPLFSPVTQPGMAHVSGRCIAGAQIGRNFAQLPVQIRENDTELPLMRQ